MKRLVCAASIALAVPACSSSTNFAGEESSKETLYVAHEGVLVSYDMETGAELPGTVQNVNGPVDMQVLADQTVMVNLTSTNEILVVDGKTMLETKRIPSSSRGATRPVHSLLTPKRNDKQYWVTLNDGAEGNVATNSALFVDITKGSPTYLTAVGEVGLGVGHHKAAFSTKQDRVVISNISDCDNVISVYDYSNLGDIKTLATLKATDLGFDGSARDKTCDPTFQNGQPPSPHGCATSGTSSKVYCNVTATGQIVVVDVDANPPTFTLKTTTGSGGGYTKPLHDGGRYIFSLQESPREGDKTRPGSACQVGQLVVIDAMADSVVKEVPLRYRGPSCAESLVGTEEETANPGHIQIAHDNKTMFVTIGGGFGVDTARARQTVLLDLADPTSPAQLPSVQVGASKSHAGDLCTADGERYAVVGNVDNNVTIIDAHTRAAVRTITTKQTPLTIASFSAKDGPGHQTGPIE